MLEIIHINLNNLKEEINEFVGQDPGNYGNSNGSSSTKYFKFISFFVNNRSGYSEQFTTTMEIIKVEVDNIKADNTVSISFE